MFESIGKDRVRDQVDRGGEVAPAAPEGHEGHDHAGHDHAGHDHAGHDHEGHDHGDEVGDAERHEVEIAEIIQAIGERFGEREPSAEELRAFLRERLLAEGQGEEEADRFLDGLLGGQET